MCSRSTSCLPTASFVQASEDEHEDLFWALRGGGGNFGVVTAFTFRLSPVPTVVGGPTLWPLDRAAEILRWYRDFLPTRRRSSDGWFAFLTVPPVAPFPVELQRQKVCGVVWCCGGAPERGRRGVRARPCARPGARRRDDHAGVRAELRVRPALPCGRPVVLAGRLLRPSSPTRRWRRMSSSAHRLPTPQSTMHLYPVDGAAARVAADATAWSYRDATWGAGDGRRRPRPGHGRHADANGRSTTGRRCIRTRWAAPT